MEQVAGDGVERRERLIHQEHVCILCQRSSQGHAVLHAAGKLVWPALLEAVQMNQLEQLLSRRLSLRPSYVTELQRQLDILGRR